jgi:hypothetical protein
VLTESAYVSGIVVYILAALVALWLFQRWLLRFLSASTRLLLVLPMAALLLTPAYTEPGSETMAPALIVSAFQTMTMGVEGASHAVRPLLLFTVGSLVLAVVLWVIVRRRAPPLS